MSNGWKKAHKPLKVVLDTNAFISCIGKASAWRNVFDAFLQGEFILCISTEILLEYEEKFSELWNESIARNLIGRILAAQNITLHAPFFNFLLVSGDPDDNKFADTFIASGADWLVSNDRQINNLRNIPFPKINVATLQEFAALLQQQSH